MLLLLISFFIRADPGGIPYCIGERAGPGAAATGVSTGGAGGRGGAAAGGGASAGSGRGLGKMCFSRLFL